jgi:hypothetical protein
MYHIKCSAQLWRGALVSVFAAFLLTGCQSNKGLPCKITMTPPTAPVVAAAPAAATTPAVTATPAVAAPIAANTTAQPVIRIDAGASASYTNSAGEVWLADQGFEGGDTADRGSDLQITNATDPTIYRTEHYGMTSFSYNLPNGKYTVKLHFAETFDGISGPGERVFSFKVGGQEFKDVDVFAKTGGLNRAYVETVNVDVTGGKLDITFTENIQSPEINGIEIIPNP